MGTGYGSVLAYSVFEASLCGGFAYFAQHQAGPVRHPHRLAVAGPWHGGADLDPDLLRRPPVHASCWASALICEVIILIIFDIVDVRARRHMPTRGASTRSTRSRASPPRAALAAGAVGHRAVLRLLVLGRLRDGAQLRRGVQGPEEDRAAGAVYLGDRARRLLHADQLGAVRRLLDRARGRRRRHRTTRRSYYLGPANAIAGHWVGSITELPDHHRLVRLRDGIPQHDLAVLLLARPRGPAAPAARQDAPQMEEPVHRLDRPVGDRRADRARLRASSSAPDDPTAHRPTCSSTA